MSVEQSQASKWMKAMIKKYGSEQAVREEMKRRQEKSRQNAKPGGFHVMSKTNPDLHRKVSQKGGKVGKV